MPPLDNFYIESSGLPSHEKQKVSFPSGVFNVPVAAHLTSFNATFGFNGTPHAFDLEYVPESFQADALPPIGSGVAFVAAGDFFIKGRIKHADYSKSVRGNVLTIRIEDLRSDLDEVFIDTFGVFGSNDAPTPGVVDVRYWYVQTRLKEGGVIRSAGRSKAFRDLRQLEQQGASYRQVYEAVQFFEEQVGTIEGVLASLPSPDVVESQLSEDPDAYRWKFKAQPLLQAVGRILNDVSYDFYWIMSEDRIGVINRKFGVNIDKDNIPFPGDPAETLSVRFGKDEGERPTTVHLLGAEMEGLVGCGDFKTESGAYGFAFPSGGPALEYDLGIEVCGEVSGVRTLTFVPGWRNAVIKFFGPDGSLREFSPTDRQLSAAIKGVEYFCQSVELDNRIEDITIDPDTGTTGSAEARTAPSGRLGLLPNRGQEGRSWILDFYNRVRSFAQNHYSRTYVLSKDDPLYGFVDEVEVVEEAWCNIENQSNDGLYGDDYKISDNFKFLSPFWNPQTNKMRAFATLVGAKWGQDGNGVPAQFDQWNEDESTQLVPIEARKWNRAEDKFREEFLAPLKDDEKGIMIRLPNLCWSDVITPDFQLASVFTIESMRDRFNGETTFDFEDPAVLFVPFEEIDSAAVPLRVKRRYGLKFPGVWASGQGVKREFEIREDLAPWNFEPRGSKQSWEQMDDEARSAMSARVTDRPSVTFAEALKIGLPAISFDSFADQSHRPSGYGFVSHGVTNLNVSKGLENWWQTKYSLRSHFPQLVKAKPALDAPIEDFNFVLHRLEQEIRNQVPPDLFQPPPFFDPKTRDGREVFQSEILDKMEIPVTINAVFERGADEFYRGVDDKGTAWPRALDSGLSLDPQSEMFKNRKAFAIDGFLQIGMRAVYHYEEQPDGTFVHYFTGGVSLGQSRVVQLQARNSDVVRRVTVGGTQVFVADIATLQTQVTSPDNQVSTVTPFKLFDVPFLAQDAVDEGLPAGTQLVMTSHGNKDGKAVAPDSNVGPASQNFNDMFLVNTGGLASSIDFAEVVTAPSPTSGEGGAITIVSDLGGTTIADGQVIGGKTQLVRFVGADNNQVRVGDQCIVKKFNESGSSNTRVFCFVNKPKFVPTSAF